MGLTPQSVSDEGSTEGFCDAEAGAAHGQRLHADFRARNEASDIKKLVSGATALIGGPPEAHELMHLPAKGIDWPLKLV